MKLNTNYNRKNWFFEGTKKIIQAICLFFFKEYILLFFDLEIRKIELGLMQIGGLVNLVPFCRDKIEVYFLMLSHGEKRM